MVVSTDHACARGNTDLLIMLIYFLNSFMGDIILKSEATKNYEVIEPDIGNIAKCMYNERKHLRLIEVFGGCNTKAIHEQCKLVILKLLEKFKAARRTADGLLQKDKDLRENL